MEDLKAKRKILKGKFTRQLNRLRQALEEDHPQQFFESMCEEVCQLFGEVDQINDEIGLLSEEASEECEKYISELENSKFEIQNLVMVKCQYCSKPRLSIKKVDPPKFSGCIRSFPTWVKDFNRLVASEWGKDGFILKSCLESEPRKLVEDLDDYDVIWQRLNECYGNHSKIVDCVLADIRKLKPVNEGEHSKLILLINTIEKAWLDLTSYELSYELENSSVLSLIERLLPNDLKFQWAMKIQNIESDKFKALVEFLVEHRAAAQYVLDNARSVTSKVSVHVLDSTNNAKLGDESILMSMIKDLKSDHEHLQQQLQELLKSGVKFDKPSKSSNRFSCLIHNTNSHDLMDCFKFRYWNKSDKFTFLKSNGICFLCLKNGHMAKDCKAPTCSVKVDGKVCLKRHHALLHSAFIEDDLVPTMVSTTNLLDCDNVILMTGFVNSGSVCIPTFYDPGSNISVITTRMANKLGLSGIPISLNANVFGGDVLNFDSFIYQLPIVDNHGRIHNIDVCGVTEITAKQNHIDLSRVAKLFDVPEKLIEKPSEYIDLLIGSDQCLLLPTLIKTIGDLQLMKNDFGLCVRGKIDGDNSSRSLAFQVSIHHVSLSKPVDCIISKRTKGSKMIEQFFLCESLGTHCNPQCGGCRCGKCGLASNLTLKEVRELKMIEEGLSYDENDKCWTSHYPWVVDPNRLENNEHVAMARLRSTENRLMKLGHDYSKSYDEQIKDMIKRDVAQKLSIETVQNYSGPVFYLPHHEILKSQSGSTPIRIVFNASSVYKGMSVNDCLAKGPDMLNNLWGILLRFRQEQVGFVGDVSKMYNRVKISELDMHMHRFLWREMDTSKPVDHYMLKTVTFGDKPGGAIAMTAMKKTAQMSSLNEQAKSFIIYNSYVDDIIGSTANIEEGKQITDDIDKILKEGNFSIKEWILSGTIGKSLDGILAVNKEKVLGMIWSPSLDVFLFCVHLNFSKRLRNVKSGPDLMLSELEDKMPKSLSKRMILSQIATLYDPLGLISPFTVKAKLLLRDVVVNNPGIGWDEPVDESIYAKAKLFFKNMFDLEKLTFRRCMKPSSAIGDPTLLVFSDGSTKAYGACAYLRWKLSDGTFECILITAKNRIAPLRQISIPRLELCGAVMASRLVENIVKESNYEFERILCFTDSKIVLGQIHNESFRFNTFVGNRISEIQSNSSIDDWLWVSTDENPADLVSRGCSPLELGADTVWQKGAKFLCDMISEWPVEKTSNVDLTDFVYNKVMISSCKIMPCVIHIERFSNMNALLSVTARILNVRRDHSLTSALLVPTAADLYEAEIFWVHQAQKSILHNWENRFKRLGPKLNENGIITVGSRIASWLKDTWNKNEFILIPGEHPLSKLLIEQAHNVDHGGIESTLARLQSKYWIPKARKFIKAIKSKCVVCRKQNKCITEQTMGQVPDERLAPSPPYFYTSLDLFGPFQVCDTVKRRVRTKVYGVVFTCISSKSVHLELAEGYDTESFIKVLIRFCSVRGFPKNIYSDNATQLVSANKELRHMIDNWDLDRIVNFGRFQGVLWKFNKSADAPWENPCSEAIIKLVKRALSLSIGDSVLTYGELLTVFYEVSNLLNQRPIGCKPGADIELGKYLCPNDLLLGHTGNCVPPGMWKNNDNFHNRLKYNERIVENFWKRWHRDYFSSLVVRQKWHVTKRNVRVGDIVIVKDANSIKGDWKLAKVVTADLGRDGLVRDVILMYKQIENGKQREIKINRSVHRIVVLLPVEEQ